jgi:hypothetical protein
MQFALQVAILECFFVKHFKFLGVNTSSKNHSLHAELKGLKVENGINRKG